MRRVGSGETALEKEKGRRAEVEGGDSGGVEDWREVERFRVEFEARGKGAGVCG